MTGDQAVANGKKEDLPDDILELMGTLLSGQDDPYPYFAKLREEAPRYQVPGGPCVLTRRADVVSVLRDQRMGLMYADRQRQLWGEAFERSRLLQSKQNWMFFKDPPEHTRLRNLLRKVFSPEAVAAMKPTIERLADEHLDRCLEKGTFDLVGDFSHEVTVDTMGELWGVPPEGRRHFTDWAILFDAMPGLDTYEPGEELIARYEDYFTELVHYKQDHRGDDVITGLLEVEEDGDSLNIDEVIVLSFSVFGAGFDTTQHAIGNAVNALMHAPDQMKILRDEPETMRNAIDEFLRYDGSVMFTERAALEPFELDGQEFEAGSSFYFGLGAANRDPEAHDRPDELDIRRERPQPMTLGGGIHFCIGAALGRLEMQIALSKLLERTKSIEPAGEPSWKKSVVIRGLDQLPVTVTAA